MNPTKHTKLKRRVDVLLRKAFVREDLNPSVVPILLTPKKDGSWRMCVDSGTINKNTVKYMFPISKLDEMEGSMCF